MKAIIDENGGAEKNTESIPGRIRLGLVIVEIGGIDPRRLAAAVGKTAGVIGNALA